MKFKMLIPSTHSPYEQQYHGTASQKKWFSAPTVNIFENMPVNIGNNRIYFMTTTTKQFSTQTDNIYYFESDMEES